ncbi:RHS repeat protein, partial [Clostridium sp. DJ247]|nr:RHS repeat protein [Clostridium sp. DJ247]
MKDPEGNVFKYEYDKAGRMTSITSSYGTVEFGYNALNKKTHIVDAKGNTTRLMYDKLGNLIRKVLPNEYNEAVDNGTGYQYRYDAFDRLIKTIDPLENVLAVKYDAEGNLIKEINPNYYDRYTDDGLGVEYEYDDNNRRIRYNSETDDGLGTEYEYDERDRLVTIKDPESNVSRRFVYDKAGRIIKEIDAKGYLSSDTDEARYGTLYKYNTAGWMLEKRVPVEEQSGSIKYNVTLYKYDKAGRRVEEKISPEYVDENAYPKQYNTIIYTYDKNSRITKITDTTGAEVHYAYDCLGNRTLERLKINANTYKVTRYYYNSVGLLEKVSEE